MEKNIKELIEDAQEKALLMEKFISKIVRGGSVCYSEDVTEGREVCAILAEIAADYSERVKTLLNSEEG